MNPSPTASKVLLLASPRTVGDRPAPLPLRRFRIARLRLDGRRALDVPRFGPVKGS